jgi:phospholipid transport system substrate-binding protein
MKIRILMTSLVVTLVGVMDASAAPMPPPAWGRTAAQAPTTAEAVAQVRQGMDELFAFMGQAPRPTGLKLAAFVEDKLARYFDFESMARLVLGPRYQRMTDTQRADVVQRIEQDFLRTLTRRLAALDDQNVRYFRPRRGYGKRTTVTVGIANPGGYPARLDFRLYRGADGWKVYDVAANGSSAVNYYRQKLARAWDRPAPYGGRM